MIRLLLDLNPFSTVRRHVSRRMWFVPAALFVVAACTVPASVPAGDGGADTSAAVGDGALDAAADLSLSASCNDGVQGADETDVDCGGTSCPKCDAGRTCLRPTDCESANCVNNVCTPSPSACMNQMRDADETDIDCGGAACPKCSAGRSCLRATDCQSASCANNVCQPIPMSCMNQKTDGQETDVDCGGPDCPQCMNGRRCIQARDCASGVCAGGKCAAVGPIKNVSFAMPVMYNVRGTAVHVVIADFNGDGKADVAANERPAMFGPGALAVFRGRGDGTLDPPFFYAADINPSGLATADFNGDKRPDLVAAYGGGGQMTNPKGVALFLNQGNGTFANAVFYDSKNSPGSLALGDFDGDGKPDVAISGVTPDTSTILLNLGNGILGPARISPFGPNVAAADLNGDQLSDVVSMGCDVYLAKPGGALKEPKVATLAYCSSPRIADFNNDGKLDVLSVESGTGGFHAGLGNGTFAPHVEIQYGSGSQSATSAIADVDLDGDLDLLYGYSGADATKFALFVAINDGAGRYKTILKFPAFKNGYVYVGDLNGDGKPDAVITHGAQDLAVLLNTSQ